MKTVEIAYRYDGAEASLRERPSDADAARLRLNDGNRSFAELFTHLEEGTGTSRRVVPIDPRDLGLLPTGDGRCSSDRLPRSSAAPMRAFRSS